MGTKHTFIEHVDVNPQARHLAKLTWGLNFGPKHYIRIPYLYTTSE